MIDRLNKNFLWMASANALSGMFNAAIFIYLARVLGAVAFGNLSYALAIVFYSLNFVDLGLSTYGIREIAKHGSRVNEYVSNIISFRLIASGVVYICVAVVACMMLKDPLIRIIVIEAGLMAFTLACATEWVFQGLERMHMVFISFVTTSAVQLSLILALVKGPADLWKVPLLMACSAAPVTVVFLKILRFKPRMGRIELGDIRSYLSSALVIWGISVLTQIYNGLDVIIIGLYRSAEEVGSFMVARRAIGGITFLMIFLANAALPRLAATFGVAHEQFRHSTQRFLKVSLGVIVLLFVPAAFFTRAVIAATVGPAYLSAAAPLKIMLFGCALILFNMPFSTGLVAAGYEKDVLRQAAASAVVNITSNLILIPRYGMIGASLAFVLAEGLALCMILWMYRGHALHLEGQKT